MSDRSWHDGKTQGVKHVKLPAVLVAQATVGNAPKFVEGDKAGATTGSYLVSSKVATGKYRLKTKDKFVACVGFRANLMLGTPDGTVTCQVKKPSQNSDGTWQAEVWVYALAAGAYALADLASGDQIHAQFTLRDSSVTP